MTDVSLGKFLSLVLRHDPRKIGLQLDSAGWTSIADLLRAAAAHNKVITRDTLERIVRSSDKQRFAISDDGLRIRANQGHSIAVELDYAPVAPPEWLYHGTATRFLDSIREHGLERRERHHVHLSKDESTATAVGARRGRPVVLTVCSGEMHQAGHVFYRSANGVWLVAHVPSAYLRFP